MAPHQTWSRRLRPVIPTLVVALLAATGCSGGGSSSGPEAPPAVFPATVTHEYGQTVVEEAPERVVSLGYTDQDAILALGTVPVDPRVHGQPALGDLAVGGGQAQGRAAPGAARGRRHSRRRGRVGARPDHRDHRRPHARAVRRLLEDRADGRRAGGREGRA